MHTYSNGTLRWFAVFGAMILLDIYLKCFSRYVVSLGVFVLTPVKLIFIRCKNFLTKFLKLFIIKIKNTQRRGSRHGKKSSVSDQIL